VHTNILKHNGVWCCHLVTKTAIDFPLLSDKLYLVVIVRQGREYY
jgi:hypothetical protein